MAASPRLQSDRGLPTESAAVRLRMAVIMENDLDRLSALFGELLDENGVPGHFCLRHAEDGMVPLFGDRPDLVARPDAFRVDAEHAPGALCTMVLDPNCATLAEKARATVRGYAVLVANRGALLAMKQATVSTACPLSLEQRAVLSRLLCGASEIDIAAELDLPVVLLSELVADATTLLGTRNRSETIALAARQGWLVMSVNPFYTLSSRIRA